MSNSAVQQFYRYHAAIYDSTRWIILHGRRRAIDTLRLNPDHTVLEIGCGTGLNFAYVLERLDPRRARLVGVDFSSDMLRRAARRIERRGWTNVELVQADAAALALDHRFDAVLFAYSLTMIPDWRTALRRAYEHLRPAGRMVVIDFGHFDGWGPFGTIMRTWLKLNHVETCAAYIDGMRALFGEIDVRHWLGGYHFTAAGQKRVDAAGGD